METVVEVSAMLEPSRMVGVSAGKEEGIW